MEAPSLLICSELVEARPMLDLTSTMKAERIVSLYSVYNGLQLKDGTRWLGLMHWKGRRTRLALSRHNEDGTANMVARDVRRFELGLR